MVDRDVILPRLKKLDELLKNLKYATKYSLDEYLKEKVIQGFSERSLELAAEAIIDIGNHFISFYGWKTPDSYREIFLILANEKVISEKLAEKLSEIASFRNLLVHIYLKINSKIVYSHIENDQKFLKQFVKAVNTFMKEYNII